MKKIKIVCIFLFLCCILLICFVSFCKKAGAKECFSFTAHDRTIVNPARGFYTQIQYTEAGRLADIKESGQSLALVTMGLEDYMEQPIPEEELRQFSELLKEARKQEIMVMFRAAYLFEADGAEPELEMIEHHIAQLSGVMNEYKDTVLLVQTGMIGLWGEWHGSKYLEDENAVRKEALQVVGWWLEYLDEVIELNLRRPVFIQMAEEEQYDVERIGLHNDALLATDSDMGTYYDREKELIWAERNLKGKISGGEMPYVSEYTEIPNVLKEFGQLHLTYLNAYYNTDVLKTWKEQEYESENALSYIEKRLGYRYYAEQITVNECLYPYTKTLSVKVKLKNEGFSDAAARFHLYLVLDDGKEKHFIRMEKKEENYEAALEMEKWEPFLVGLCLMDGEAEYYGSLPEFVHTIELANEGIQSKEGVSYFVRYAYEEQDENVCKAERIVD